MQKGDLQTVTLLKIPADLTAGEHERASERIVGEGLDGLELSSYGGAYGPVWDPSKDYELGFLRHYRTVRRLHIGVRLKSLEGIQALAASLEAVSLQEPPGGDCKVSLAPLASCNRLAAFSTAWRGLDLEPVGRFTALTTLGLTGAGAEGLAVARALRRLTRLDFAFGNIKRLDGLEDLSRLEHLRVSRIRELEGLPELAEIPSLRTIELDCLARIATLPDLSSHQHLHTLICSTMKGLQDLDGLRGTRIRELALIDMKTPVEALRRVSQGLPHLERLVLHLGGRKATETAKALFHPSVVAESTNEFALFHHYGVRQNLLPFS